MLSAVLTQFLQLVADMVVDIIIQVVRVGPAAAGPIPFLVVQQEQEQQIKDIVVAQETQVEIMEEEVAAAALVV